MATENVRDDISDEEIDALFQQVMSCDPAINPDQIEKLASLVSSKEDMVRPWRMTAAIAGKDGSFFKNLSEDPEDARAMAQVIEPLSDFADLCREMAKLADCVRLRLSVAGCAHEQFNEWMAEGEASSPEPTGALTL